MPELVGQMGGQATVANNEQIIEGIEAGVARAMLQVLGTAGSGGEDAHIEIPLIIDGRELGRASYNGQISLMRDGVIKPVFA